jgi:phosphomannomutase
LYVKARGYAPREIGDLQRFRCSRPRREGVAYDPVVLDPSVFKAYDVRGIYGRDLDEQGAYRIGRAYAEEFRPARIAVGRDMRVSSPAIAEALTRGAADGGATVLDLGLVGTEMVYFAVGELGLDGGIMVTASHNPKEYTGMKIVRGGALPVGGDSGLLDVRDRALAGFGEPVRRGTIEPYDVWPAFVDKVLSFVDPAAIRPLRVVIDAANGMAGAMLPPVLERLPVDAVRCYFEPDGTFPNHEPNPLLPENREFIVARTRAEGADLGVAYDGDADRCFFVDDTGEFVPGDFVTALLAEAMLEREPGGRVIYDVRASWAVPRAIEAAGGVPLVNRVGHAFIKHRMREENAIFGGEVSAHYYFRDFSQADSGVVPFVLMLELISRRGRKLSEIVAPFRERYHLTGEINTPVADVEAKLRAIEERYAAAGGRISHLDGVSVDFDDWHFNVRPSNTEPLLRLNLEALSAELMAEKRDEVLALIRS